MPRFRYQFPYKKIQTKDLTKSLPVIPVEIHHNDQFVVYEALIDSGSELCVFHADLAEVLGINLKGGKEMEFGGITGAPGKGYIHAVELKVRGDKYKTACVFSKDIADYGYGILGHVGFFDHYRVRFEYDIKNIELMPIRG